MITRAKKGWIIEWVDREKRDWVSYKWYPELKDRGLDENWNGWMTVGEYICGLVKNGMVEPGLGLFRNIK